VGVRQALAPSVASHIYCRGWISAHRRGQGTTRHLLRSRVFAIVPSLVLPWTWPPDWRAADSAPATDLRRRVPAGPQLPGRRVFGPGTWVARVRGEGWGDGGSGGGDRRESSKSSWNLILPLDDGACRRLRGVRFARSSVLKAAPEPLWSRIKSTSGPSADRLIFTSLGGRASL
jgi:hypothetical protein